MPTPPKTEQGVIGLLDTHKSHFQDFRYLFDSDETKELLMLFREFSNLSFSALSILGEVSGLKVVCTSKDNTPN
jgi:hypothetical protein